MNCLLCNCTTVQPYEIIRAARFFTCTNCHIVFRDPEQFFDAKSEMKRYQKHTNDVLDPGYQNSVKTMIEIATSQYNNTASCLDFGAGEAPIVSYLLALKSYEPELWDPFFHPDTSVLQKQYDFITCSETIEHFYHPLREFQLMYEILKPKGTLYCKTALLPEKSAFADWYYKNDHTHVVFYSPESINWIQKKVGFSSFKIVEDIQIFQK